MAKFVQDWPTPHVARRTTSSLLQGCVRPPRCPGLRNVVRPRQDGYHGSEPASTVDVGVRIVVRVAFYAPKAILDRTTDYGDL